MVDPSVVEIATALREFGVPPRFQVEQAHQLGQNVFQDSLDYIENRT